MFRLQNDKVRFRVYAAAGILIVFIVFLAFLSRDNVDMASDAKVFKMGDEVQSDNFRIKVNSVKEVKQIKDKKTPYSYFMVSVTVQNSSKEARKIESDMFKLISTNGEQNIADEEISVLANNGGFIKKQLNPGLSTTGYVVFEILKESGKHGYVLEAYEDEAVGNKVSIRVED